MNKIFTIISLLLFLISCEAKHETYSLDSAPVEAEKIHVGSRAAMKLESPLPPSRITPKIEAKIIRTGDLRIRVKSHEESMKAIERTVKDFEGYISSSNTVNDYSGTSTDMTIRVKSEKFNALINALIKHSTYVDQKSIHSEDVTTQFIDTEARLKAKKEVERRYLELLKQAKSVEEMLKIEEQLGVVRGEIESQEGTLKYLNDQVAYSTINLNFHEYKEGQAPPEDGFFSKIGKGVKEGWKLLLNTIVGIFYLWPFVLILGLTVWFVRKKVRQRRARKDLEKKG